MDKAENELLNAVKQFGWTHICRSYILPESFIEKYADKVNWNIVSKHQKLSESIIEKYIDKVSWYHILLFQKLSEEFIEKYNNKLCMYYASIYQKLSENFIEKHIKDIDIENISIYQKLSKEFIEKHKQELGPYMKNIDDSWQYKTEEYKKQKIMDTGLYECYDDYFIAYKGIRSDRYSAFNFQYQYLPGETYETFADYSNAKNSFGFSAWIEEEATDYCSELIVKVKIYYKDVARIIDDGRIRCCKMTIVN